MPHRRRRPALPRDFLSHWMKGATTQWVLASCCLQRFPKVRVTLGHPRFVHDLNRLTAGGIASGLDAALKLIELLGGTELKQRVRRTTSTIPIHRSAVRFHRRRPSLRFQKAGDRPKSGLYRAC